MKNEKKEALIDLITISQIIIIIIMSKIIIIIITIIIIKVKCRHTRINLQHKIVGNFKKIKK